MLTASSTKNGNIYGLFTNIWAKISKQKTPKLWKKFKIIKPPSSTNLKDCNLDQGINLFWPYGKVVITPGNVYWMPCLPIAMCICEYKCVSMKLLQLQGQLPSSLDTTLN